ncbi:hypothetical protein A7X67_06230 [Clostridium sp. W14A]|nr:hypothetical protein A7X67_06230 [Clostridium sp. W14A]
MKADTHVFQLDFTPEKSDEWYCGNANHKFSEVTKMEFRFNVTGSERKRLAGAISEILNAPMKYLGAPGFGYEVGDYTVDKNGTVSGEYRPSLLSALAAHGFEPEPYQTLHFITP